MNGGAVVDVVLVVELLLPKPESTISSETGSSAHPLMVSASASSPMRSEIDDICLTVLVGIDLTANGPIGLQCQLAETDEVEPRFERVEMAEVGSGQRVDVDQTAFGPAHRQFVDAEHCRERGRVGQRAHAGTPGQRRGDRMGGAIDHQIGGQPKDHLRTNAHVPHDDERV